MIHRLAVNGLLVITAVLPRPGVGQPQLRPGTTLFQLDLSTTPVGDFPASLELVKGIMEVVLKNGVPMLKASAASEFRITLPPGQVLPRDFTLEFDLIPKLGSNPQDLSFEGTPTINQGSASAHVLWHATGYLAVIGGGGDNYETAMPEEFRATLPGVLTKVVVEVEGPTIKLYTNGRRLYTLEKQFARGRVLRVFLGGQDAGTEAVYLAGLRITTGSGLGIIAAQAGLPTRGQPAPQPTLPNQPPQPPSEPPPAQPPSGPGTVPTITVTVTMGPNGPVVSWTPVPKATGYTVSRSKSGDPTCCNRSSGGSLFNSTWQDQPLPMPGTYDYRVIAATPSGSISGGTQFDFVSIGTPPQAPTPPPPTPLTALPAAPPSGTITPMPAPPPPPGPVSAPTGITPKTGASTTIAPVGPATLTVSGRAGWGAMLKWSEVVNAVGYQVDRSVAGGPFTLFAGVDAKAQPPVAGFHTSDDVTVLMGTKYAYRVMARFATGPASTYSPIATFDAPPYVPQISNLTATLGPPFNVTPTSTAPPQRTVTWSWLGVPGALTYEAEIDQLTAATNGTSLGKTRLSLPSTSYSLSVETGRSVSICISLIRPASVNDPLQYGICLTTDVPAVNPPPAPNPPPSPPPLPSPGPATFPIGGAANTGPVNTAKSAVRNAARCTPGTPTASPPQRFMVFGMRVGGAPLQWINEANTEYLVERATAGAAGASVTWTRLTASCDLGNPLTTGGYLDEDLITYPVYSLIDAFPGVRLGGAYQYRLTRIQTDGSSGSATIYWEAPSASFQSGPSATVNGNTVDILTGVSYCQPLNLRCDPWMLDFAVTVSSSGFTYASRQTWVVNSDPLGEPGTMTFKLPNVPSGTHTFTVTALYQPDHRVVAGSVTVQVP